jgi:hypothetical protein
MWLRLQGVDSSLDIGCQWSERRFSTADPNGPTAMKRGVRIAWRVCVSILIAIALWALAIVPLMYLGEVLLSPAVKRGALPRFVDPWMRSVSQRFTRWGRDYLDTQHATRVEPHNVAATEWPMFGSVFYLLAAEELDRQAKTGAHPLSRETQAAMDKAVHTACAIVVDPGTATHIWCALKGRGECPISNIQCPMCKYRGLTTN